MTETAEQFSYDQWARLLAEFFFDPAHQGAEILFAADDLALSEASGLSAQEAPVSLANAVASVIGYSWSVENVAKRVRAFRNAGDLAQPHPALPFLALTVLAASQMGAFSSVAGHNYYVPLRRLLDPQDRGQGAPGSFIEHIRPLWDDLATWANDDLARTRGEVRIRPTGHLRFVGLGLQHALVRSSDLRRLDEYFRRIGLEPNEDVSPGELRRGLVLWVSRRHEAWAQRLHRVASDDDLVDYCEALLGRAAKAWDGRPRDVRTGRPVGRLRVGTTSLKRPDLAVFAQNDDRLPENLTLTIGGERVELLPWEGWFKPLPLPIGAAEALNNGVDLNAGSIKFVLNQQDAHALGFDDDLGGWVTVDRLHFGERYAILIRSSDLTAALTFLKRASAIPPKVRNDGPGLPSGWSLVEGVRIDVQPATAPPESIAPLIPSGSGPRLRLEGGLRVSSERHVYLRGGEPALILSSLVEENEFEIQCVETGKWASYRVPDHQNREAALWELKLEPGDYDVMHGPVTIRFTIVDGIAETAGPGVGGITQRGRDGVDVSGVVSTKRTRTLAPRTVPAPTETTAVFLVGPGANDLHRVEIPGWLEGELGWSPSWKHTDAWVSFEPAWLIVDERDGATTAEPLRPQSPEESLAETAWSDIVRKARLTDQADDAATGIWASYQDIAARGRP